ncbi:MAG: threonine synthase [Syntrophomonadaceae bacterium]|jgi:threonine synthase|nr:threonine synthase [Syntrophomonadaceae bacterium]MDH7497279.1 threonine synthase [Syntrophomonadaceae bacterium]
MNYESTRGQAPPVPSMEVIKAGLAPDGGLYVPERPVVLAPSALESLRGSAYQDLARTVLGMFLTDFSSSQLAACVEAAYAGDRFDTPVVVPVVPLEGGLHVMELWHGPTAAFKDMALQILPHLLTTSCRATSETAEIVILVATSGDTGKAALEGFRDVAGTRIVVFYPAGGVSQIQERQMVTQEGANVEVVGVRGNFDDAQAGVKAIFSDAALGAELARRGIRLSSANSINWGRLVPQVVYYLSSYLALRQAGQVAAGEAVNVVVPTGNFGNILAAYYAREMGVPVKTLVCAANANNVLTDFIRSGVYDRNRPFYQTISPSMDILVSSNLERLLYSLSGRDAAAVRGWMEQLSSCGRYQVDEGVRQRLQQLFWSDFASDEEARQEIRRTFACTGYLLDPHTAVGSVVYRKYLEASGDNRTPTLLAGTASPFKFARDVAEAVLPPETCQGRDEFQLMELLADRCGAPVPAGLQGLRDKPVRHGRTVEPAGMASLVRALLGL